MQLRFIHRSNSWVTETATFRKGSLSFRLHEIGAPFSDKLAISGGNACVSRKIGH